MRVIPSLRLSQPVNDPHHRHEADNGAAHRECGDQNWKPLLGSVGEQKCETQTHPGDGCKAKDGKKAPVEAFANERPLRIMPVSQGANWSEHRHKQADDSDADTHRLILTSASAESIA
jgi:hypothetical protein